jgi:hypothetical protein
MRLYETTDSPLVCAACQVARVFFFISLVFTPVARLMERIAPAAYRSIAGGTCNLLNQSQLATFQGVEMQRRIRRVYIGLLFAAGCPPLLRWSCSIQCSTRSNGPGLAIVTVALSPIGALFALYFTGTHSNVSSGIGTLALFGVALETGVIMIVTSCRPTNQIWPSRSNPCGADDRFRLSGLRPAEDPVEELFPVPLPFLALGSRRKAQIMCAALNGE